MFFIIRTNSDLVLMRNTLTNSPQKKWG